MEKGEGQEVEEEKEDAGLASEIGEHCSELTLKHNSIRGYVSVIKELWAHQVSILTHNAPSPHGVALKTLQVSVTHY